MIIAIQPDFVRQPNGEEQSFSSRWMELAEQQGIEVRVVDVFEHAMLDQIRECSGFMWRYGFDWRSRQLAQRLLPSIEHGLGIPVFPDWRTSWPFEDKLAQRYLLDAAGLPTPETWVFWNREDAITFARQARYPLVVKLSAGIRSGNVALLKTPEDALGWIERLFGSGINDFTPQPSGIDGARHRARMAQKALLNRPARPNVHHDYFYVQEFLPDNVGDTRITIIGKRAYGFRRFNRDNDFRASGSGKISWDPTQVDEGAVRLAFAVAQKLGTQSVAVDVMRKGETLVVGEVSYAYAAWALRECPGHWSLDGPPETANLRWNQGQLRCEDAIFSDFVDGLRSRAACPGSVRGGIRASPATTGPARGL